jgi:hypothetical protein
VKAGGGYVIWWPAAGQKILCDDPLSEWPRWLIVRQQPKPERVFRPVINGSRPKSLQPLADFVASLQEGSRNTGTFWGFCRAFDAVAEGLVSESEAFNVIAEAASRTGLAEPEIRAIARSARNRSGKGTRRVG